MIRLPDAKVWLLRADNRHPDMPTVKTVTLEVNGVRCTWPFSTTIPRSMALANHEFAVLSAAVVDALPVKVAKELVVEFYNSANPGVKTLGLYTPNLLTWGDERSTPTAAWRPVATRLLVTKKSVTQLRVVYSGRLSGAVEDTELFVDAIEVAADVSFNYLRAGVDQQNIRWLYGSSASAAEVLDAVREVTDVRRP